MIVSISFGLLGVGFLGMVLAALTDIAFLYDIGVRLLAVAMVVILMTTAIAIGTGAVSLGAAPC
jgi:hypothetical protein